MADDHHMIFLAIVPECSHLSLDFRSVSAIRALTALHATSKRMQSGTAYRAASGGIGQ